MGHLMSKSRRQGSTMEDLDLESKPRSGYIRVQQTESMQKEDSGDSDEDWPAGLYSNCGFFDHPMEFSSKSTDDSDEDWSEGLYSNCAYFDYRMEFSSKSTGGRRRIMSNCDFILHRWDRLHPVQSSPQPSFDSGNLKKLRRATGGAQGNMPSLQFRRCVKNPGHPNFIPALEFAVTHLPDGLQTDMVFRYVENYLTRTTKVTVDYVSQKRPKGYPFCTHRGSDIKRLGSGWVTSIGFRDHVKEYPEVRSWEITVNTACHVVFDKDEAKATRVDLFFDDYASNVATLTVIDIEEANVAEDRTVLVCVTRDEALALRLDTAIRERALMWHEMVRHLPFDIPSSYCVVVSHPHGEAKRVTVGDLKARWVKALFNLEFKYNADTCPGSAGGPVVVLPGRDYDRLGWLPITALHKGTSCKGVNQSGLRSALWC